jgi:hypothetical protein
MISHIPKTHNRVPKRMGRVIFSLRKRIDRGMTNNGEVEDKMVALAAPDS